MSNESPTAPEKKKTARTPIAVDPQFARPTIAPPVEAARTKRKVTQFAELKGDGRGTGGNFSVLELHLFDTITEETRKVCVPLNMSPQDWPRLAHETVPEAYEVEYATEGERDRVLQAQRSPEGRPYGYGPHNPLAGHWVEGVGMVGNGNSPFRQGAVR